MKRIGIILSVIVVFFIAFRHAKDCESRANVGRPNSMGAGGEIAPKEGQQAVSGQEDGQRESDIGDNGPKQEAEITHSNQSAVDKSVQH